MDLKGEIKKHTTEVRNLPMWLQYVVAGATIFGTVFGAWGVYIVLNPRNNNTIPTVTGSGVATSTVDLSEILSKALSLETVVERQDFLNKYKGSIVTAQGTVTEVSRSGNGFIVDIKVSGQTVTCPQEPNQDLERQVLLLQGKRVQLIGKFPFTSIWEHGLGIDDCALTRLQ